MQNSVNSRACEGYHLVICDRLKLYIPAWNYVSLFILLKLS